MARRSKREYPDDDGRTIVPMNVDGMPWYTPPRPRAEKRARREEADPLSREDCRHYILGAVTAALAVGAVFGAAIFLFITFCEFIWFR